MVVLADGRPGFHAVQGGLEILLCGGGGIDQMDLGGGKDRVLEGGECDLSTDHLVDFVGDAGVAYGRKLTIEIWAMVSSRFPFSVG